MFLYVYQVSDTVFGCGLVKAVCEKRGRIVEKWPISTQKQRQFLIRHGSSYGDAYDKVTELVEIIERWCKARGRDIYEGPDDPELLTDGVLGGETVKDWVFTELAGLSFFGRLKQALNLIFLKGDFNANQSTD